MSQGLGYKSGRFRVKADHRRVYRQNALTRLTQLRHRAAQFFDGGWVLFLSISAAVPTFAREAGLLFGDQAELTKKALGQLPDRRPCNFVIVSCCRGIALSGLLPTPPSIIQRGGVVRFSDLGAAHIKTARLDEG